MRWAARGNLENRRERPARENPASEPAEQDGQRDQPEDHPVELSEQVLVAAAREVPMATKNFFV